MAQRTTKKKDLTPEEKLAQALVIKEDQLFQIPSNWAWIRLRAISQIRTGKKDANYGTTDGRYLFFTCASEPIRCNGYSFDGKAILLAGNGDISNISLYEGKFEAYQRTYVLTITEAFSTEYVYYYFKYRWVDYNVDKMFGTAIPYIRLGNLQEFPLPIPPFSEQQRIVARIESLFAKLDEAKEKAQAVLDGFEERKAAILHKAFTGELTKKWREERGIESQCHYVTIDSVCKSLKYGTARKSVPKGSVVVIRMGNLQHGEIDWTNLVYSTDEDDNQKYRLSAGDVLFNRTNSPEWVGKTSIYRGEYPAIYAGYLIKLDYDHSILEGEYLNYVLNTPEAKEYCNRVKTDGVNQSNINAKKIGAFSFPLPSLTEQQQIISTLHDLLDKQQQAKSAAEQVLDQIDTMKKAILARAFRGELGTNAPQEESAVELVRRALV